MINITHSNRSSLPETGGRVPGRLDELPRPPAPALRGRRPACRHLTLGSLQTKTGSGILPLGMSVQDEIVNEFSDLAKTAKELAGRLSEEPYQAYVTALQKAVRQLDASWSGSWIGYHARVYLEGFAPRTAEVFFDAMTGFDAMFSRMHGPWRVYEHEAVKELLFERVLGPDGRRELNELAREMHDYFLDMKSSMIALLDALLSSYKDRPLKELREKLESTTPFMTASGFVKVQMPRTVMTQDNGALAEGLRVPPHKEGEAWLMQVRSHATQLTELARLAERGAKYVDRKTRLSVAGVLNQLKETFVSEKSQQGERKIRTGRGSTVFAGDMPNATVQQANSSSAGGDLSLAAGNTTVTRAPLQDSATMEQEQFNKDVAEILHALTDAKESLESDRAVLIQFFASLLGLDVQEKTVGQLKSELSQKIQGSPAQPALQRLTSHVPPITQGIVSNVLYGSIVQPVLAALAALT